MKYILLAGSAYEESLYIEDETVAQHLYNDIPGSFYLSQPYTVTKTAAGIDLLEYFLKHLLPDDHIDIDEKFGHRRAQRILTAEIPDKKGTGLIKIKKAFGFTEIKDSVRTFKANTADKNLDLVFIEDSGLPGDETFEWASNLLKAAKGKIIYKAKLISGDNKLLQLLCDSKNELILIVDADDLRREGIRICQKQSWDKTIEEIRLQYNENPVFNLVKKATHLVIRFGCEGVLLIHQNIFTTKNQFLFFYLPAYTEGQIIENCNGISCGEWQAFSAALIKYILYPHEEHLQQNEIISASIGPAMQSCINCATKGLRFNKSTGSAEFNIKEIFNTITEKINTTDISAMMASREPVSIISNEAFKSAELINYLAFLYLKDGKSSSFDVFPYEQNGKLKTYDREEIDGYRMINERINNYLSDNEKIPLSIGVFGPPGSGKSFGIKQIIAPYKDRIKILEFNLSQFRGLEDLDNAFHEIQDANLEGKIPLAFFDEFDSALNGNPLGWLVYFIMPMQDGKFRNDHGMHTTGKAIYIFAGGIFKTAGEFNSIIPDEHGDRQLKDDHHLSRLISMQQVEFGKVKDFASRIKLHLNIKGINKRDEQDQLYTLRRAIVMRNMLTNYKHIFSAGRLNGDDNMLYALLTIPEFKHGARSMETIINASGLHKKTAFCKADLPPSEQLNMHINGLQLEQLMKEKNVLPIELIESIAQEIHENWLKGERGKGSVKETMKPWNELPEDIKDSNRQQAIDTARKLEQFNFSIVPLNKDNNSIDRFDKDVIEHMAEMEHERYVNEKKGKGWIYGPQRNDEKKIHPCLLAWSELDEKTKDLDRNAMKIIPELLKSVGFAMVKDTK